MAATDWSQPQHWHVTKLKKKNDDDDGKEKKKERKR
jgi:hypothetical protein